MSSWCGMATLHAPKFLDAPLVTTKRDRNNCLAVSLETILHLPINCRRDLPITVLKACSTSLTHIAIANLSCANKLCEASLVKHAPLVVMGGRRVKFLLSSLMNLHCNLKFTSHQVFRLHVRIQSASSQS